MAKADHSSHEFQNGKETGSRAGWSGLDIIRMRSRFLIIVPLLLIFLFGLANWERLKSAAWREAGSNVQLVREFTLRLVQAQEILLQAAEGSAAELQDMPQRDVRLHRLRSLDALIPEVVRLGLVGPDGNFILNSNQFPALGNVRDRDYVRAALAGERLFIDRLVVLPENRDVLIISKAKFRSADSWGGMLRSIVAC